MIGEQNGCEDRTIEKRVDEASRLIRGSASEVYRAFARAQAMESWLPPQGMSGTMLEFDFREGGAYRLRLTYNEAEHSSGKTSEDTDEVEVRFIKLVPHERIEQVITFESDDPAFAGEMRMIWTLESVPDGTLVTVRGEDVPPGIGQEDHQAGMTSTLSNLATFVEEAPMTLNNQLLDEVTKYWRHLRGRTYELLDVLQDADLSKRLPFPESQTLGYQLSCMLAMSNSIYTSLTGKDFQDHGRAFSEALSKVTVEEFRQAFKAADEKILAALEAADMFKAGETSHTPMHVYLYMTEHEALHHGQLVNFIYAHNLPIPPTWFDDWNLTRD